MPARNQTIIDLEKKFWQSMVDQDTDTALEMLSEPSLMVSSHGATKFDHASYRKMAEQGTMVIKSFELSDMEVVFPNDATAIVTYRAKQSMATKGKSKTIEQEMHDTSTWVQKGKSWQCVMHTETPVEAEHKVH